MLPLTHDDCIYNEKKYGARHCLCRYRPGLAQTDETVPNCASG